MANPSRRLRQPVLATASSFEALPVDSLATDSDSDLPRSPPRSPSRPPPSVSTKKGRAKQRARDRARKAALDTPPELLPSASAHRPLVPPSNPIPHQTAFPLPSLERSPATPPSFLAPHQPVQLQSQPQSLQPPKPPPERPTSPCPISLGNSLSNSPSTTDLDYEDDDYEESGPSGGSAHSKPIPLKPLTIAAQGNSPGASWTDVRHRKPGRQDLNPALPQAPLSAASTLRISLDPTCPDPDRLDRQEALTHSKVADFGGAQKTASQAGPPEETQYGADHNPLKKWQTILTRVIWSLVMVGGFVGLMTMGHVYLIVLVFIIQFTVFREVTNLFQVGYKAAGEHAKKQVPATTNGHRLSAAAIERKRIKDVDNNRWSKVMSWYFFCAVNYFLYGESIIYYFKHIVFIDAYLLPFARHHRFISLLLYLIGFTAFVANLTRGHLRRQFGLFSWIHMSLLLIVASGQFMVNNILEGLIWFWVPASLVIMNDVAAYVFGMLFGRHQLIKLSPKKTVEGFVGGYFTTVIFAVLWGTLFMGWNYMICPVRDLGVTAFSPVECVPNNAFVWRAWEYQTGRVIWWTPFQIHCLVLGTFAGLVAPFGGFFASGFKRAFNIKDFADTIPGHGGLTDRFDCQFIMGLFTHFYYTSLVREQHVTVGSVLEIIASSLNSSEQLELYQDLGRSLIAQGLKQISVG